LFLEQNNEEGYEDGPEVFDQKHKLPRNLQPQIFKDEDNFFFHLLFLEELVDYLSFVCQRSTFSITDGESHTIDIKLFLAYK